MRRAQQAFDIQGTVVENWVEVVLVEVDAREKGMEAQVRGR